MNEAKVLDYNKNEVKERLLRALRSATKDYTNADLARTTGLPLAQISAEMPSISDEYRGRLKVSEQGDLLYSFPYGLRSKYKGIWPSMKKVWSIVKKGAVQAAKILFKVWILVTLFGYFFLFIALALVAFFGSIAIQQGGGSRDRDNRRGGGGLGGLWLTTNIFDSLIRLWFYSELFKSSDSRRMRGYGTVNRQRHPLHKAVFSHVFGDGDPNADWNTVLKKTFVAFVQSHKGVITLPEFMALSGLKPQEAQDSITRFLVEFEGTPEVSEKGALYFFFPSLLAKNVSVSESTASSFPIKNLKRFSSNNAKLDRSFRWINGVNLVFGSYFLANVITLGADVVVRTAEGTSLKGGINFLYSYTIYLAAQIGISNPVSFVGWVLGCAPLVFSALFFGIPLIRSSRLKKENEAIKQENMRKILYSKILSNPQVFETKSIAFPSEETRPDRPSALQEEIRHLAAWSKADITADGLWRFDEISFIQDEAERVRSQVVESIYAPQSTIFDSEDRV